MASKMLVITNVRDTEPFLLAHFDALAGASFVRIISILLFISDLFHTVTTEKPIQAKIYQVKKLDRGDNNFKKKCSWGLRELKVLDAKDGSRVESPSNIILNILINIFKTINRDFSSLDTVQLTRY